MTPERIADRYRITDRSASGGMGSVHVAVDERLDREVAVKIMRPNLTHDPRFVERFRREARSAAALNHPNIAQVFDYGTEDDLHFIVMELAPGRDLAKVLQEEGPLEPSLATHIAQQIASALGHAHSSGIVHRDMKPANVIVADDRSVKVTDFGIARATGDATLTASGVIMGSIHYISPEQAVSTPAVPASDVYSLGIVLYEMLTGSVPFQADSAVAIAIAHADGPVPRPRLAEPSVPSELDAIVARATARAPEDRYLDGKALEAALAGFRGVGSTAAPTIGAGGTATASAAATATLPFPEARDTEVLRRTPVIPLDRAARLGGAVLLGLALVAVLLAAFRAADSEGPREGARGGAPAETETEPAPEASPTPEASPSPSPEGFILPNITGQPVKEWEKTLRAKGFTVVKERIDTEEFERDAIVSVSPEPGTLLLPGETVTLTYSSGKEPKGNENEGEDD